MKRTRCTIHGGLGILALALGSCSTQRSPPLPEAAAPLLWPVPQARAATPAEFVAAAGSIDLFVVRASEMALARNVEPRVAAIATRLRDEHRGLAAQLSMAGRRLDVLPAAALGPRDAQRLAQLAARTSIDMDYLVQMHAVHDRSMALHRAFAAPGASATLRPVAVNGAQTEHSHLALLGRGGSR